MNLDLARDLALDLMSKHLTSGSGWGFQFDNAKRRFGLCSYSRNIISLSRSLTLLNDEASVRDTILHEIAHANVGHEHAHDEVWQAEALRLGSNGRACFDVDETVMPVSPWMGQCPGCKHVIRRWQRPGARPTSCGRCAPRRYDPQFQIQWSRTIVRGAL